MGQADNDKVKGQNLSRMNLIVKRIESELDQLKNLINLQINGLTTTSPSTNCDGDSDSDGNCDTSISIIDTLKIEYSPIDTSTAEDVDKVSNSNSNYQYEFNNEGQEVEGQTRPSNEDELILGGVDFNCEMPSKEAETHADPPQSSSYNFTNFQNQDKVISQAFVDHVDFKPDVVESIQISNRNLLERILLVEVAAKKDKKLKQKLTVQMGVRCDQNPRILNSNRAKISPSRQRKTEKTQKESKIVHFLSKSKKSGKNCSFCSKSFRDFSSLSDHMRVHTGERPFKCKICSKSFKLRVTLKRHSRVHTGEKPYSCSVCSRTFALRHHQKDHMRVHTGEKRYSCSICGKKFARSYRAKMHEQTWDHDREKSVYMLKKEKLKNLQ